VQSTFRSKVEFSIPFTIKPGKTVYLGEFRAMDITGQNLFGIPLAAGAKFQIFDRSTRDLAIAKRKDPAISAAEIRIPDPAKIGRPFFERLQ
jgi:hypothetical protein